MNLTPGVKLEKKNTIILNKKQSINILNVNLLDPYTSVGYGIDDLQAIYELPHNENYFTSDVYAKTVKPDKVWSIKFNTVLSPATVTDENIYIQDENGVRQPEI